MPLHGLGKAFPNRKEPRGLNWRVAGLQERTGAGAGAGAEAALPPPRGMVR